MTDEDGKVFHYGERVIDASGIVTLKVSWLRLSGTRRPANGATWWKTIAAPNRHSRPRNCVVGEHKDPAISGATGAPDRPGAGYQLF
jgi:hypothetical protein